MSAREHGGEEGFVHGKALSILTMWKHRCSIGRKRPELRYSSKDYVSYSSESFEGPSSSRCYLYTTVTFLVVRFPRAQPIRRENYNHERNVPQAGCRE